jgi:Mor family transcriptional regulator
MAHELTAHWDHGRLHVQGVERCRFEGDIEYYKRVAHYYTTMDGTEWRNKKLAEAYRKGRTIADLAIDYGISTVMVRVILGKQGITMPNARGPVPPERGQEIHKRWKAGEKQTDLAVEYKISRSRVQQICRNISFELMIKENRRLFRERRSIKPPPLDIMDLAATDEIWTPEMQAAEFESYRNIDIM